MSAVEFIEPPDQLGSKVSYGPGGVDAATLDQAEAAIAALRGEFVRWMRGDLEKMRILFDAATAMPAEGRGRTMRSVHGCAHDMRGQGGSFGFPLVTEIAATLCRFLETRTVFGSAELDAVDRQIEALRKVVDSDLDGDGGDEGEGLLLAVAQALRPFA